MSQLSRQEELRRRTGDVLDRDDGAAAERRGEETPQPGDVFGFAETAEPGVLWAVLERSADDPRRLLAVAADVDPRVGSADVAVGAGASCGALTLRCRLEAWLDASDFEAELRVGSTDEGALDLARRKRAAIVEGGPVGSALERETDSDPEYQDLREEIEQARAALLESRRERDGKPGRVVTFPAPPPEPAPRRTPASRWAGLGSPYAMAASVLLVVTLGLSGGLVRQIGRLEESERARARAEAEAGEHDRERQRLEETHRQTVSELRQDVERAERRIADLEARTVSPVPLVDLPFAWLSPREEPRGAVETIRVAADAPYLVLILEIDDPEPYSRYRIEIREAPSDAEVFASELSKTGATEVSVALPRGLVEAGEYQVLLYGLRGARAELVEEYAVRVELE